MCDRDQKLRDVVELTSRLMDDHLGDADHARLESMLFGDPEACELYLNVATLHAHLTRELGGTPPVKLEPQGVPAVAAARPTRQARFGRRFIGRMARFAVAASVLLMVGVVSVMALKSRPDPTGACATLIELRGVAWAECSQPRQVGDRLEPQTIGLTHGTAVIRFDGGATATLTGPGELLIESRKAAELKSGSVLIRAEKESAGFTMKTAASDFVDLGTEFGVVVNADGSSEIHVFEGVVIARPRASDVVVPILGNEAGRIEADRGDVMPIEASPLRFTGVTTALPVSRPIGIATIRAAGPIPADARIVFIGDRATDQETHLLLINQTLGRLFPGEVRPRIYNAGIAMPLAYTESEIRNYVLAFRPTHAVIEFGPEIAAGSSRRSVERFEGEVRRLLDRLLDEGIEPIIATGFKLGERQAQCQSVLDDYNRVLRRLSVARGCRLADVDAHFRSLEKYKLSLVAPNGAVPTFTGSREMAAVLLGAIGHAGIKPDDTVRVSLQPGAITLWKYRLKAADDLLDEAKVSLLTATGWTDLLLPQPDDKFCSRVPDATHICHLRDRARGFATNLHKGDDKLVEAVAMVESSEDITAFLCTGGHIKSVHLNGERIYDSHGRTTGSHAGTERLLVDLRAGPNQIVVEAAGSFFVGVTDNFDWPVQ